VLLSYEALAGAEGLVASSLSVSSLFWADKLVFGFNAAGWLQASLASDLVTDVSVLLYTLHMPLVVVTSVVLWYGKKHLYGRYVAALAFTSFSALLVFLVFPTSPPWNDGNAVNLLQQNDPSASLMPLAKLTSLIESDKFAAFPRLHAAYAVTFCFFIIRLRKKLAVVAVPLTAGILFSTLYLGQHYVVDLIAGASLALVSCYLAEREPLFSRGDSGSSKSGSLVLVVSASTSPNVVKLTTLGKSLTPFNTDHGSSVLLGPSASQRGLLR
jgi:membrane-associated phospholipid phosphatase